MIIVMLLLWSTSQWCASSHECLLTHSSGLLVTNMLIQRRCSGEAVDGGGRGEAWAAGPLLSFESLFVCPSGGSRVMETAPTSGGTPTLMGNQTPAFVSFKALQVEHGGGQSRCVIDLYIRSGLERKRRQREEESDFTERCSRGELREGDTRRKKGQISRALLHLEGRHIFIPLRLCFTAKPFKLQQDMKSGRNSFIGRCSFTITKSSKAVKNSISSSVLLFCHG